MATTLFSLAIVLFISTSGKLKLINIFYPSELQEKNDFTCIKIIGL